MLCHGTTNSRACGRFPQKKCSGGRVSIIPLYSIRMCGRLLVPYHRAEIFTEHFLSTSFKLLYQKNMHGELNIYKDSLCSIRSSRGTRQEALRQEKVALLGKLSQKCPVWRVLRRNSPVLFFFPGAPSVLVGGSLGF